MSSISDKHFSISSLPKPLVGNTPFLVSLAVVDFTQEGFYESCLLWLILLSALWASFIHDVTVVRFSSLLWLSSFLCVCIYIYIYFCVYQNTPLLIFSFLLGTLALPMSWLLWIISYWTCDNSFWIYRSGIFRYYSAQISTSRGSSITFHKGCTNLYSHPNAWVPFLPYSYQFYCLYFSKCPSRCGVVSFCVFNVHFLCYLCYWVHLCTLGYFCGLVSMSVYFPPLLLSCMSFLIYFYILLHITWMFTKISLCSRGCFFDFIDYFFPRQKLFMSTFAFVA